MNQVSQLGTSKQGDKIKVGLLLISCQTSPLPFHSVTTEMWRGTEDVSPVATKNRPLGSGFSHVTWKKIRCGDNI